MLETFNEPTLLKYCDPVNKMLQINTLMNSKSSGEKIGCTEKKMGQLRSWGKNEGFPLLLETGVKDSRCYWKQESTQCLLGHGK